MDTLSTQCIHPMNSLPECTIPLNTTLTFRVENHDEYDALCKEVTDYLEGDCCAIVVNNEVLFNTYIPEPCLRHRILDGCIRDSIRKYPHQSLLAHLNRAQTNGQIYIYMNCTYPFKISMHYTAETNTYTVKKLYSAIFVENFGAPAS
jgi:hypothetical protein